MALTSPRHIIPTDLPTIERRLIDLNHVERQTVLEKGMLLKHVKDNNLTHGKWLRWLAGMDIGIRTAQRYIQAYEQFGNATYATHLTAGLIFDVLPLPPEIDRKSFLTEHHTVPSSGETKLITEMSQKERREVVKAARGCNTEPNKAQEGAEETEAADEACDKYYRLFDAMYDLEESDTDFSLEMNAEGWYKFDFHSVMGQLCAFPPKLLRQLDSGDLTLAQAEVLIKRRYVNLAVFAEIPVDFRNENFDIALRFSEWIDSPIAIADVVSFISSALRWARGVTRVSDKEQARRESIVRLFTRDIRWTRGDGGVVSHYANLFDNSDAIVEPFIKAG